MEQRIQRRKAQGPRLYKPRLSDNDALLRRRQAPSGLISQPQQIARNHKTPAFKATRLGGVSADVPAAIENMFEFDIRTSLSAIQAKTLHITQRQGTTFGGNLDGISQRSLLPDFDSSKPKRTLYLFLTASAGRPKEIYQTAMASEDNRLP